METLKFKTNIKCSGCIAKLTPSLNETVGENNWEVDLQNPDRILTVKTEKTDQKVIQTLKEAGFEASKV
ncbi:heavy metal transport/detoxification protein [Pelobium sp.]|nr:heavy metal transport/detoxification protein [Pelobium sp.]MDA9555518.1 heavy metal transport/detoxification protein [Pelobium sp.]